jgi:hypothetical protein
MVTNGNVTTGRDHSPFGISSSSSAKSDIRTSFLLDGLDTGTRVLVGGVALSDKTVFLEFLRKDGCGRSIEPGGIHPALFHVSKDFLAQIVAVIVAAATFRPRQLNAGLFALCHFDLRRITLGNLFH